ncbi:MAG TPA: glycosyl hydrolase, partial [Candidatus Paceibacterota bacterium]|nr:glycosyl hydrolase [Candidatus Paceibacterota bacterium]
IENHYRAGKRLLNQHGLELCAEAGGPGVPIWSSCPVEALKALGSVDILRGEFWPKHRNIRVIKEVASAAHIYGIKIVDAESFTSWRHWQDGPYFNKQLADIALGEGLNRFTFHTFTHSPDAAGLPGLAYHAGTHINPNEVWWPMARPFVDYLSRCSHMLQQGHFVADVCYYYGDKAPNFVSSKHLGFSPGIGYDYDAVNSDVILNRMTVKNGRLVLPDGMSYALLVLPHQSDMDLDVLRKIAALVKAGATVVGPKPSRTGTLVDYPRRDGQVAALADQVWGPCDGAQIQEYRHGKGRIVWNRSLPTLLRKAGIPEDFSYQGSDGRTRLDYLHRRMAGEDVYFVCNLNERWEDVACTFRVGNKQPELWHPETGEIRPLPAFEPAKGRTRLHLHLAPAESVFVVFRKPAPPVHFTRIEFTTESALPRMRPHLLPHAATPGGPMWLSDGNNGPEQQQITFDLATVRDLSKIRLWNYNDHARGNLNYGIKDFTVEISADNVAYRACGKFTLHAAPENEEREYGQEIEVTAQAVRYVRLAIQSNQNQPNYLDGISPFAGLSKVVFFGPEEIFGVRVASVSSGVAFDPATDGHWECCIPPPSCAWTPPDCRI